MPYKIVISEIIEKEVPETEYEKTEKKDEDGKNIWAYIKTGNMEIKTEEKEIYIQKLEDLDVAEIAMFINRAR